MAHLYIKININRLLISIIFILTTTTTTAITPIGATTAVTTNSTTSGSGNKDSQILKPTTNLNSPPDTTKKLNALNSVLNPNLSSLTNTINTNSAPTTTSATTKLTQNTVFKAQKNGTKYDLIVNDQVALSSPKGVGCFESFNNQKLCMALGGYGSNSNPGGTNFSKLMLFDDNGQKLYESLTREFDPSTATQYIDSIYGSLRQAMGNNPALFKMALESENINDENLYNAIYETKDSWYSPYYYGYASRFYSVFEQSLKAGYNNDTTIKPRIDGNKIMIGNDQVFSEVKDGSGDSVGCFYNQVLNYTECWEIRSDGCRAYMFSDSNILLNNKYFDSCNSSNTEGLSRYNLFDENVRYGAKPNDASSQSTTSISPTQDPVFKAQKNGTKYDLIVNDQVVLSSPKGVGCFESFNNQKLCMALGGYGSNSNPGGTNFSKLMLFDDNGQKLYESLTREFDPSTATQYIDSIYGSLRQAMGNNPALFKMALESENINDENLYNAIYETKDSWYSPYYYGYASRFYSVFEQSLKAGYNNDTTIKPRIDGNKIMIGNDQVFSEVKDGSGDSVGCFYNQVLNYTECWEIRSDGCRAYMFSDSNILLNNKYFDSCNSSNTEGLSRYNLFDENVRYGAKPNAPNSGGFGL